MIGQAIAVNALIFMQQTLPPGPGGLTPEEKTQIAIEAMRRPNNAATGILVPLFFFAFLIAVIWLRTRLRQRRIQAQADLQKQLLDKFTSGPELSAFLESPGGQRFLAELHSRSAEARAQVVRSLRTGIILFALGVALLVLRATLTAKDAHETTGFLIGGVIVLALGVGFLLSAAISHFLAQKWEHNQTGGPSVPTS